MVPRAVFLGLVLSAALVAGCSHRSNKAPVANIAPAATTSESQTEQDPCALLDPKEVEAVFGAPLAMPPFHTEGGTPQHGGTSCGYQDADFHNILVDVSWSGGAMLWKMYGSLQSAVNQNAKGMLHLADGSDIAGEWDEARVMTCCTFMALRGDQTVKVDVGGTATVTIQQAAKLADAALKRLDKPLPIDGDKGVKPAIEYAAAHRPKRIDPCTLLSRADAEALMGPLTGDPKSEGDTCTYPRPGQGNIGMAAELKVRWTGGIHELRETNAIGQGFAKGFLSGQGLDPNEKKAVEKIIAGPAPEANHLGGIRSKRGARLLRGKARCNGYRRQPGAQPRADPRRAGESDVQTLAVASAARA